MHKFTGLCTLDKYLEFNDSLSVDYLFIILKLNKINYYECI